MGLVASQHVGSYRTRARTRVPCIGRWILNHRTTREARTKCFIGRSSNNNNINIFVIIKIHKWAFGQFLESHDVLLPYSSPSCPIDDLCWLFSYSYLYHLFFSLRSVVLVCLFWPFSKWVLMKLQSKCFLVGSLQKYVSYTPRVWGYRPVKVLIRCSSYRVGLFPVKIFFFWLCHTTYGILLPWLGIEPGPLAVKSQSPNRLTSTEFSPV